eukprot:PITA_03125
METVHAVVAIAAQHKWTVYQMDVKSTFLNGVLKEGVYVAQLLGYEIEGQEDKVYWLKKALYGLKQAPCTWYNRIDAYLLDNGFKKCDDEPTLYIKESEGNILIVILYIDDLIFIDSDDFLIADFKQVMKSEFEMTDLGLLKYFLGIEAKETKNGIFISQAKYVVEILERFKMQNNITYAVSLVSRFMEIPKETHWQAVKRILRYFNGTKQYGILYTTTSDFRLVGYTDNDWAGSVDDRKSTSGYVFHLGSGAISWASKKQSTVSSSIVEAEYVAATATTCQVVWMRRMLRGLLHDQEGATTIFYDNTSTIALSKNFVFHKRTQEY